MGHVLTENPWRGRGAEEGLDAITTGSAAKTKAAERLSMLGVPVPHALKG